MPRKLVLAAAAAIVVFIVFATLSPMAWRPVFISHAESEKVAIVERLLAYAVMGFLVAILLPRHIILPCVLIVLFAAGLELAQALRPDRDALFKDVVNKAIGGILGIVAARFSLAWAKRRAAMKAPRQIE